jgi:hypothetical protein
MVAEDEIEIFQHIADGVQALTDSIDADSTRALRSAEADAHKARITILVAGSAAVLTGILLAYLLVTSITRPLGA